MDQWNENYALPSLQEVPSIQSRMWMTPWTCAVHTTIVLLPQYPFFLNIFFNQKELPVLECLPRMTACSITQDIVLLTMQEHLLTMGGLHLESSLWCKNSVQCSKYSLHLPPRNFQWVYSTCQYFWVILAYSNYHVQLCSSLSKHVWENANSKSTLLGS